MQNNKNNFEGAGRREQKKKFQLNNEKKKKKIKRIRKELFLYEVSKKV